jgi:putative SOS response-associated peptidase YedK
MCGSFALRTPTKGIIRAFGLSDALDLKPRFNITPTQQVAAIRLGPETGTRQLSMLRWGLVPAWGYKGVGIQTGQKHVGSARRLRLPILTCAVGF